MWTTCWPTLNRRSRRSERRAGWRGAALAVALLVAVPLQVQAAETVAPAMTSPAAPVTAAAAPPASPESPPAGLLTQVKGAVQGGVGWLAGADAMPLVLEQGTASFLWSGLHGRKTASGERYDMNELTAAHKTLPFGTRVIVRSLQTGREVAVRIIDRGPHLKSRIIDLSHAAVAALGIKSHGISEVQIIQQK